MKKWFNIIVYISLIFLAIKLYQANYLTVPKIYHFPSLCISVILIFSGMIANTLCWRAVLRANGHVVFYSDSLISIGLSIFTKYIPGKFLMILGRAEYISQAYNISRKDTSSLSLTTQMISIWVGLTFGILGTLIVGDSANFNIVNIAIVFWLLISILIFSSAIQLIFLKLAKLIGKKNISFPNLNFVSTLRVIPYFLLNWLLWCVSFYFLCRALSFNTDISIISGFAFALGASIGILTIFAPGGLGVREAIIGSFLILLGLSLESSTTIAITSRLWFLTGEIFIFIYALILRHKN